jgi:hypothetical protein
MKLLAVLLLCAAPCYADELPDKPVEVPAAPHTRWELVPVREVKHTFSDMAHFRTIDDGVLEWAEVGAYFADQVTTVQASHRIPRSIEIGTVCYGHHTATCGIVSYAVIDTFALVVSHALTKHMNHWYTDMVAGFLTGQRVHAHASAAWLNSQK